MTKKNIAQKEM